MSQTLGPHLSYYWTLWQSEWATDLIMDAPVELTGTMASLLTDKGRQLTTALIAMLAASTEQLLDIAA